MLDEIIAGKDLQQQRMRICKACPWYTDKWMKIIPLPGQARCQVCGCFLKAKTALKPAACPKGNW